ncbi:MAG TPA: AbrB/MazE/SpoVT family DNA-binding domain-containing protein [Anaeromyxobacteraceae bacterium]|nr:AbrB/MazE/SpoVT family DNA-binding domain-containing protein [Anaeromyxobacteraceae bacterium]
MIKKLTRTGNSLALVIERDMLTATGIDASTPLEVSTDGEVIVISPVRGAKRNERLREVMKRAHGRYAGTFKRLAE